jgi:hypothetical protein
MRRVLLTSLVLLLLAAVPAEAKFSSARVCGAHDCRTVALQHRDTTALQEPLIRRLQDGTGRSEPPPRTQVASGWYRVTFCPGPCGAAGAESLRVLPAAGFARMEHGGWRKLPERAARAYDRVTRGLDPLPPSRLIALDPGTVGQLPADPVASHEAPAGGGIPPWAWIAIPAGVVALSLVALRWLARRRWPSTR